jgi:2,3,4,5-tetrahydropyridine-2-carboxylate N-succinyltransferase
MEEISLQRFNEVMDALERGEVRVAQKVDGEWKVNRWVKEVILAGFKLGAVTDMSEGQFSFLDKDTFPLRRFKAADGVRIVPGGSSIRRGAYLAPGSIVMPPAYVNVGAYVGEGTMVDSHATIGSCAQVGRNIHISAATQIGGVLEPAGALPTIIEDGAFVGGNCGIYEGTIVQEGAVIASGVIITSSTALFDTTTGDFVPRNADGRVVVPRNAVVVSGSRPIVRGGKALESGVHLYCPVIVKYRDEKTAGSVHLEELLR